MKLSASASAIGLSVAYLAAMAGCSSDPSDPNTFHGAGAAGVAGAANPMAGAAGTATGGGGMTSSMAGAGGATAGGTSAGAAGMVTAGGAAGAAGAAGMPGTAGAGAGMCPAGVTGHCDPGATYPTYADYTLNLVEDFTNPIDLNADPVWTWSDGIPNDSQTGFAEPNVTFANGHMILTAESKCAAGNNPPCYVPRPTYAESYSDTPVPRTKGPYGVISGELRTKFNNYRYGRYEVKFKAPNVPMGNFLSTMFVFRNPTNTAWNEIDIELEANKQGKVNGNVVNAPGGAKQYPGGSACAWTTGETACGPATPAVANLNISEDHIYAFTWTPDAINWYLDNNPTPIRTHVKGGNPAIPSLSAKIMMNLWVFASNAAFGDPSKNPFPAGKMTAEYDYFHYYKWSGETMYPVTGHPTGADYVPAAQNNGKEVGYGL
jgi:hypothetical protein